MTCERHCEQCARESYYEFAREQRAELEQKILTLPPKMEYKFLWRPLRDPKSKETFWLRHVTLIYRPYIRRASFCILSLIDYRLSEVLRGCWTESSRTGTLHD